MNVFDEQRNQAEDKQNQDSKDDVVQNVGKQFCKEQYAQTCYQVAKSHSKDGACIR